MTRGAPCEQAGNQRGELWRPAWSARLMCSASYIQSTLVGRATQIHRFLWYRDREGPSALLCDGQHIPIAVIRGRRTKLSHVSSSPYEHADETAFGNPHG